MSFFKRMLGVPTISKEDKEIIKNIKNSYKSISVSERGTITVDPLEVSREIAKKGFYERAKKIVTSNKK